VNTFSNVICCRTEQRAFQGSSQAILPAGNVVVRCRQIVRGPTFNSFHCGCRRDSGQLAETLHLGKGSGSALPSARGIGGPVLHPGLAVVEHGLPAAHRGGVVAAHDQGVALLPKLLQHLRLDRDSIGTSQSIRLPGTVKR
jgi:hypothetical protein